MYYRKSHTLRLISSLVLTMALSGTSFAQDANRVDQLENRMQGLETKMDALIDLMTKEKSTSSEGSRSIENTSGETGPANKTTAATGLKPGMNLDLYSVVIGDEWPASPPGFPIASAVVNSKQPFNLGLFKEVAQLKPYANPSGKSLGQFFSGKIFV